MNIIRKVVKKFPSLIVQGFFALLPIIVTSYAALFLLGFLQNVANSLIVLFPQVLTQSATLVFFLRILLIGVFLVFLGLFGFIVRSMIGKWILKILNAVFSLIPGLSSVYNATEQVVGVITSEKKSFFKKPVLVEYPSAGIWAIGFNTGEINISKRHENLKQYTIFIPTTPIPTSGFLAIVTEDKIQQLDLSAEDAIKLILTGGIVKQNSIDL